MKCPGCAGTGRDDNYHLALHECERCSGTGSIAVEELNPAALKAAASAYWSTLPESEHQPFNTLSQRDQINLSWHAASVITAYQT